jgi:hypothetical protein
VAGQNLTTFDECLKEVFLPTIRRQLNDEIRLYKAFSGRTPADLQYQGSSAIFATHIERNAGRGARADGGTMPTAGKQKYLQSTITCKYNYQRIKFTGPTIAASRGDTGSWARVAASEMKGALTDLKVDMNRQCWGYGKGILALVDASTTGTTLYVDAAYGVASNTNGLKLIQNGDVYQFYSSGGAVRTGTSTVASQTASATAPYATVDALPQDIAENDEIYINGNRNNECMGLMGLVDANAANSTYVTTLQGISRSSYSVWDSKYLDNTGVARALTEDLIQEGFDLVEVDEGGKIDGLWTTTQIRRKYFDLLYGDRRFAGLTFTGGSKKLQYASPDDGDTVSIEVDRMALNGSIYGLDYSHLFQVNMRDFHWRDDGGGVLQPISGEDAVEALLRHYGNKATDKPNSQIVWRDISE